MLLFLDSLSIKGWRNSVLALVSLALSVGFSNAHADERPNIIMMLVDDSGYSDFSGFGGEADMPALDSLASVGMKMTNFRAMPTCSPTRSVALTGVDNHLNGLGTMQGQLRFTESQPGNPGYEGYLNKQAVTVANLLKDSGYHTYMSGKWHLGIEEDIDGGQTLFADGWWPKDRGFKRSYGMLEGGGEHFGSCERAEGHCTRFYEDDELIVSDLPANFFSGKAHMDKAIEFIDEGLAENAAGGERKPFYLYYADTMVHEPLQLPDEYIERSMEKYYDHYLEKGWDGLREERFQDMLTAGIIPAGTTLHARHRTVPAWSDESDPLWANELAVVADQQEDAEAGIPYVPYGEMWLGSDGQKITTVAELKKTLAKKMTLYTGMLEYYDDQIGRMITHLKDKGEYENTVFFYVSDNGSEQRQVDFAARDYMYRKGIDNSFDNLGRRGSFVSLGRAWTEASNAPLWGTKAMVSEGGTRVGALMAYPKMAIEGGKTSAALTHVSDLAATALSYAAVEHPAGMVEQPSRAACTGTYGDRTDICPVDGRDLSGLYAGDVSSVREGQPLGMELFGLNNRALLLEENGTTYKLIKEGMGNGYGRFFGEPWRLFDLGQNLSEHPDNDLSGQRPELLKRMIALFNEYELSVGIVERLGANIDDAQAGAEASHVFTVANDTESEETFDLACHSDWDCKLSAEGSSAGADSTSSLVLAAGEAVDMTLYLQVPDSTVQGKPNSTHVEVNTTNQPQLSYMENFVTRPAETVTADGGGGSMDLKYLLLMLLGVFASGAYRRYSRNS